MLLTSEYLWQVQSPLFVIWIALIVVLKIRLTKTHSHSYKSVKYIVDVKTLTAADVYLGSNRKVNRFTYPKVFPGRFANQSILIITVNVEDPVVPNDRDDGQEGWNIKLYLQLGFIRVWVSLVSSTLYGASLSITPSLVQYMHSPITVKGICGSGVHTILGLKKRRE